MEGKEISQAVISRLPRYYRYLGELKDSGVERISSQDLSKLMKVTASQIRQDFNNFGGFGQQGYGYNVEYLYNEIAKILGLHTTHNLVIVGAGNLGQALANYNFEKRAQPVKDCDLVFEEPEFSLPEEYESVRVGDVVKKKIDEVLEEGLTPTKLLIYFLCGAIGLSIGFLIVYFMSK